jgi:hypothetical protein
MQGSPGIFVVDLSPSTKWWSALPPLATERGVRTTNHGQWWKIEYMAGGSNFTIGFEGMSLGQRLPKDPDMDEAALCARFVSTQA